MLTTSVALLQALFNAGQAAFYMSAEEGSELHANGFITVDANATDPTNPMKYLVRMTESGVNALSQATQPVFPGTPSVPATVTAPTLAPASKYEIESDIAIPAIVRAGNAGNLKPRTSSYPFDLLQVGQSFHVAATAEDAEPHKKMASNVSAANKRSEVPAVPAEMVTTKHKRKVKDAQGKPLKGADGKDVYELYETTEPKMVSTKKFVARQVNASDPKGAGVRVFRAV